MMTSKLITPISILGDSQCCNGCPNSCKQAALRGQCPRECQAYSSDKTCCAPSPCDGQVRCVEAAKRGQCLPECEKFRGEQFSYEINSIDTLKLPKP